MLGNRLDMSERRPYRIVGQHRSTQRGPVTPAKRDDVPRKRPGDLSAGVTANRPGLVTDSDAR